MLKSISIGAGFALIAGTPGLAAAADLPSRQAAPVFAPVPARAPVPVFAGLYVGAQVGYAAGRNIDSGAGPNNPSFTFPYSPRGVVGGGLVGYNYQIDPVVLGIEGDVEGAGLNKTQVQFGGLGIPGGGQVSARNNFRASVRGRAGYALGPVLLYATGGVAFANYRLTESTTGSPDELFSSMRTGYTVGGGVEYAFNAAWTARLEYRYSDFGKWNTASAVFPGYVYTQRLRDNAVRAGVTYKFLSPEPTPVVARY